MNDHPTMEQFETLEKRVAELEHARLSVDAAIDRVGIAIGETISARLATVFDENIQTLVRKIDDNNAAVLAQFEKLHEGPQEH
jgi:hypothetical protein